MDLEKRKTMIRASRPKRQRAALSGIIHHRQAKLPRLVVVMLIILTSALCVLVTQAVNIVM